MYFVYALISEKDSEFYIGYTEDIEKRIKDHNEGKNSSAKTRRPLRLLYYEAHTSKTDALKRERYFKTTKGKTTLRQIIKDALSLREPK